MAGTQGEPGLIPVEVVADAENEVAVPGQQLRVVTRGGHVIDGLSLADVVELVRVLG
jgi:hypothetical protein